jgi:sporulation protein YlmC with PRC-barrel domain
MPHYGTLRDYKFKEDIDDIRGSDLYGARGDEKLGEIDDVIFDHTETRIQYIVVDTGGWLKSQKFLVPATHLRGHSEDPDAFRVDLDKEQIERFPPYDEKVLESEKDWKAYENRYLESWRHARDIGGTELAMAGEIGTDPQPERTGRQMSSTTPMRAGATHAERWSRFENLMHRHRADLLQRCNICERDRRVA